ncbi:MAG: iron-sulfur cluster assembly scaffold protein [Pyrinomonadaceae bacterium]
MAIYTEKVQHRAFAPQNRADTDVSDISGRSASFVCGCFVSFSIKTKEESITAAFESNGCGYMIAAADILAEAVSRKQISNLHGLDRDELFAAVVREIGGLPAERRHCGEVSYEALRNAFAALRARRIEEFRGEEALICTCFGVSERAIEDFVASKGDVSVESVAYSCRAGSGCGSCRMLIQEIIDTAGAR